MIENFLQKCSSVQTEEKNRVLPIAQLSILHELWKSDIPVSLSDIRYKYDLERYTVSRNAQMLSNGFKYNGIVRKGKGWITEYDYGRNKKISLTLRGKIIAKRLFDS